MSKPTDSASRFNFALGNTENKTYAPHEIIIDNVVVRKVATPSALILNGTFDDGMDIGRSTGETVKAVAE